MASADVVYIMQRPHCIAIGQSGEICKINDSMVVKYPKSFPGETTYNELRQQFLDVERQIYERLGHHDGILQFFGVWNETGAIRLAYANQGDLRAYIRSHDAPPQAFRKMWIRLLVETFYHIYSRKVLHQDVKLNNILISNDTPKVADFANGAIFPIDADMELICAQDPLSRIDLLGIGCIMYSIGMWQDFEYDYFENDRWPTPEELPSTHGVLYGEVIARCWNNEYSTVKSLYEDFRGCSRESGV
ncbi:conserved hypothetical protein [Histoplasma capsulatum G186AR]|uniref:Serine/threonine-protein kinase ATG1 n=2 Tax=Ajellomyces capsulatus TaxID=5037 RepID=C0NPI6_AJECG|nr:uncharacterized protein HCBG_05066 [Histoplasma capsulatum G186AR]EEH06846.1 conserved hypothetical protein [Histoplasma capsulatum G186AR]KAG5294129.1 hypothetical protein I7I52_05672 [Histoplasma capsulatum]QSS75583.1 hypothetical protein I7I50_04763 [Histoplasma capsulatum G186AR]